VPDDGRPDGPWRPADECPWRRPFPKGFDGCSAFEEEHFTPLDSRERPLAPILTCRQMVSRLFHNGKAGWYGACEIGDEAARRLFMLGGSR
jgi:hypothetical protein